MSKQHLNVPVAIVGAGIAGLWLANRLQQQGIKALVIEKKAIGAGQTMASQGIIHGGTKYVLDGKLNEAASQISQMTARWQHCFEGNGELDLSNVHFLSNTHYMWIKSRFGSSLKSFISRKLLSSNTHILPAKERPAFFNRPEFAGSLCALYERVVDVPSLLDALIKPLQSQLIHAQVSSDIVWEPSGHISALQLTNGKHDITVSADSYVFLAGEENQALLASQERSPVMQRRPLHMVWLKRLNHPLPKLFVHIIERGSHPTLTITTHQDKAGNTVWYLGGNLAEMGDQRSQSEQQAFALSEIQRLLPWCDVSTVELGSFLIDRAENENQGKRPHIPYVKRFNNVVVGWPIKLTMAPLLADLIWAELPRFEHMQPWMRGNDWAIPPLAIPPWQL